MQETKEKIEGLVDRLAKLKEAIDLSEKRKKIEILEAESANPNLWDDQEKARDVTSELAQLKKEISEIEDLTGTIDTLKELSDSAGLTEGFGKDIKEAEGKLTKLETLSFLSGDYDERPAIVSIHAGQGGTEAMDWANMLFRMYLRLCERRGWQTLTVDTSFGDEAGIKSATFKVFGRYAYGYLKGEAGTHRLVRQSPFNADKLRQTSFALVEVLPELASVDLPQVSIKEEDLEWEFFRSSSQGGQNVQKVSTAVRVIHKPTNLSATSQSERFQEQNRKNALDLLRIKLWVKEKEKEESTKKGLKGEFRPASWGNQIRSYVLHPYKMVKDLRTGIEISNTEAVLDGEIDEFIEAELKLKGTTGT